MSMLEQSGDQALRRFQNEVDDEMSEQVARRLDAESEVLSLRELVAGVVSWADRVGEYSPELRALLSGSTATA